MKECGYDIDWKNDRDLITMSIFHDYGIPDSEQQQMHYRDFVFAVAGLDGESRLGQVIRVRKSTSTKDMNEWEIQERYKWNKHLEEVRLAYLDSLTEEERDAFFKKEIAQKKAMFNH